MSISISVCFEGIVLFWLRAIVELRDSVVRTFERTFDSYHEDLLCRVRFVANNMKIHFLDDPPNKSILTEYVREYLDAAQSGFDINWRQESASPHVFLGVFLI